MHKLIKLHIAKNGKVKIKTNKKIKRVVKVKNKNQLVQVCSCTKAMCENTFSMIENRSVRLEFICKIE